MFGPSFSSIVLRGCCLIFQDGSLFVVYVELSGGQDYGGRLNFLVSVELSGGQDSGGRLKFLVYVEELSGGQDYGGQSKHGMFYC